jgi:HTH-like domain
VMEAEILKKRRPTSLGTRSEICVHGEVGKRVSATVLCRVLAATKSAYYHWKLHGATVVDANEFALCARLKALFAQSRDSLGSRAMVRQLRQEGHSLDRYQVRRLMKRLGLVVNREFSQPSPTNPESPTSPSSGPCRAGRTWRWSWTCTRGGSSAGAWTGP